MKSNTIKLLIFAILSIGLLSCKSEPQKSAKNGAKKTTTSKSSTAPKTGYWTELQKSLSLTDEQTKKLKGISKKYNDKKSKMPNAKSDEIKKVNAQKNAEIRTFLGKDLSDKKLTFDRDFDNDRTENKKKLNQNGLKNKKITKRPGPK